MNHFLVYFIILKLLLVAFHAFFFHFYFHLNIYSFLIIFFINTLFTVRIAYKKIFHVKILTFIIELLSFIWFSWNTFAPFLLLIAIMIDKIIFNNQQFITSIFFLYSIIIIIKSIYILFNPKFYINIINVNTKKGLAEQSSLKIVIISDLHINQLTTVKFINKLSNEINKQNPDLIFIVGDMFSMQPKYAPKIINKLKEISHKNNIIVVSGNSDYTTGINEIKNFYQQTLKWIYLSNNMHFLPSYNVTIYGAEDPYYDKFFNRSSLNIISSCLKSTLNKKTINILLYHRNNTVYLNKFKLIDYQFSGHAHGGHYWPSTLINKILKIRYVKGLFHINQNQSMYVTQGCGYSTLPIHRLGTKTEITVLNLKANHKNP